METIFHESRDICLDEPFTIFNAQRNVWDIIKLTAQNEPNPPMFMLLLHFWIKIFGIEPLSVRFLPLLFNALTAVVIYNIGRRFFSLSTAIISSMLFIVSTYHFYFGLEARTYSLLSLTTATSLYFFLSLIQEPQNRRLLIALIVSNFVMIYSHYFGLFVVFVQFIIALSYYRNKKILKPLLIGVIITGLTFLPMAIVFIKQFLTSSKGTWVQPPSKSEYLGQIYWFLNSKKVFVFIFSVALFGVFYRLYSRTFQPINKKILIIFLWWFVPYTIMFMVSFKVPMFINRYILFNTIGIYIFIATLLSYLFSKHLSYAIGAVTIIMMYLSLQINSKDFYYREVKNTTKHIEKYITHNSIVIIHPHWADLGFMYYHNKKTFQDVYHFDSLCKSEQIYPVWNLDFAKEYLKANKGKRVLFYEDEASPNSEIANYLNNNYTRVDEGFYPQCFYARVYEPFDKDSINCK